VVDLVDERQAGHVAPNGTRTVDRRMGVGDRRAGAGDRRQAGTNGADDARCAIGAVDISVMSPLVAEEESANAPAGEIAQQQTGSGAVTGFLDVSRKPGVASLDWRTDGRRVDEVAVLIPCRNEGTTIAKVVTDFRRALPGASVYVYDNASNDDTAEAAREAGAIVRHVPAVGKGNVVRRMFAEIDANVYLLADGDDTYDAAAAPQLVQQLIERHLDMIVGARVESSPESAYPRGHRFGNRLLTGSVHWLFRDGGDDVLSGYRAFSRRYAKSFPAVSAGFETETEMTVHALELSLPFGEIRTDYRSRPTDSSSKLRAIPDGLRILKFILHLWKDYRPLSFFGSIASILALAAVVVALLLGGGRLHAWTPETFAFAGLMCFACVAFLAGVVLDSVGRTQREVKRMLYLAIPDGGGALA